MSKLQGQKRVYSGIGTTDNPKAKFAKKTSSTGFVKRERPPSSTKPWLGKKTDKKPFVKSRSHEAKPIEEKRRKRPITAGGGEEDAEAEEAEDGDEGMEFDAVKEDPEQPAEKRPRMSKSERVALHAAQPHRNALLPSHPLLQGKLLPLWETARRADLSKEERKKAVKELSDAVRGRVAEVSRGHKGGRVLQTVCDHQYSRQG